MALGKNLKKKKLIPEETVESKEKKVAPKKEVKAKKVATPKKSTSKKPTSAKKAAAAKKKPSSKKVAASKSAPSKLINKPKKAKASKPAVEDTNSVLQQSQEVESTNQLKEPVTQEVNAGLPMFIAQELHDRKKNLRSKYAEDIKLLKGKQLQFVVIEIGGESYAIDIDVIKEVVPIPELSKTPNTPPHIKGIANVRGNTYPVYDLATKFRVIGDEIAKFLLVVAGESVLACLTLSVLPSTFKTKGDSISSGLNMIEDASLDVSYIKGIIQHEDKLVYYLDIIELLKNDKAIVVPDNMPVD